LGIAPQIIQQSTNPFIRADGKRMPETEQTKVCRHCAETIKAAAKVCPYCRKSQRRWGNLTAYEFCAILITALVLGTTCVIARDLEHARDFGPDKNKILVTSFHFDRTTDRHFTHVFVVGMLTNGSEHSWRVDRFQVRYLDTDRRLLGFDDSLPDAFAILPKSEHAFRLDLYSPNSVSNFTACTVQVVSAHDPNAASERR
jgi:hypothetical protein